MSGVLGLGQLDLLGGLAPPAGSRRGQRHLQRALFGGGADRPDCIVRSIPYASASSRWAGTKNPNPRCATGARMLSRNELGFMQK